MLNIKLRKFASNVLKKRNSLAERYFQKLKKIKEICLYKLDAKNVSSYHQFVIRTQDRNKLRFFLKKNKISTLIHYPYMLNELSFFNSKKKLNNSKNLGNLILSLPISEEHSFEEIDYICNIIKKFFRKKNYN